MAGMSWGEGSGIDEGNDWFGGGGGDVSAGV